MSLYSKRSSSRLTKDTVGKCPEMSCSQTTSCPCLIGLISKGNIFIIKIHGHSPVSVIRCTCTCANKKKWVKLLLLQTERCFEMQVDSVVSVSTVVCPSFLHAEHQSRSNWNASTRAMIGVADFCSHGLLSARAHNMHIRVLSELKSDCEEITTIMHKVNATGSGHNIINGYIIA